MSMVNCIFPSILNVLEIFIRIYIHEFVFIALWQNFSKRVIINIIEIKPVFVIHDVVCEEKYNNINNRADMSIWSLINNVHLSEKNRDSNNRFQIII